jgi:hypothetical protein
VEEVEVAEVVVSEVPMAFQIALWTPAFFVVLWFMLRLFRGRWITDVDE